MRGLELSNRSPMIQKSWSGLRNPADGVARGSGSAKRYKAMALHTYR
jgi:hypothetical protein